MDLRERGRTLTPKPDPIGQGRNIVSCNLVLRLPFYFYKTFTLDVWKNNRGAFSPIRFAKKIQ